MEHGDDFFAALLIPGWAIRMAQPEALELGAQLATKDGRRFGNAHIIAIEPGKHTEDLLYTVLTDAGNIMRMSAAEIHNGFHPPRWISDVDEVKAKFLREPQEP